MDQNLRVRLSTVDQTHTFKKAPRVGLALDALHVVVHAFVILRALLCHKGKIFHRPSQDSNHGCTWSRNSASSKSRICANDTGGAKIFHDPSHDCAQWTFRIDTGEYTGLHLVGSDVKMAHTAHTLDDRTGIVRGHRGRVCFRQQRRMGVRYRLCVQQHHCQTLKHRTSMDDETLGTSSHQKCRPMRVRDFA